MIKETNTNTQANKRIAKNTLMLYIRMLLTIGVSLYTSRVVLRVLGVEDFGIYNVVGGIVVLFSFLQNALTTATQRFLNYELGLNNVYEVKRIFNTSIGVYFLICLIILILGETVGVWYISNYLNIPLERKDAALWVFQISLITTVFQIMRMPYNASIIAYEKMSFYAFVGILEVVLNLVVALILLYSVNSLNKLILYALLILFISIIIFFIYIFYCNKKFETTKFQWCFDKILFTRLLSFSGWSLFGSLSVVGVNQGVALLLNFFNGVIVNASLGIANQVGGAVNRLIMSFQTAFSPQIVKSYASHDYEYLRMLILKTSKYSYYLMLIPCIPILLEIKYILYLWLGETPMYVESFTQLTLLYMLVDSLAGPYFSVIYASGKIKNYQIIISLLMLFNICLVFAVLKLGLSPNYALIIRCVISILSMLIRVVLVDKLIQNPFNLFLNYVVKPIFLISLCSALLPFLIHFQLKSGFLRLCLVTLSAFVSACISIYFLGLDKNEKSFVNEKLITIFRQK